MGDEIADGTEQSLFELRRFSQWFVAMAAVAFDYLDERLPSLPGADWRGVGQGRRGGGRRGWGVS